MGWQKAAGRRSRFSSGVDTIMWLDNLEAPLQTWIHLARNIYLDTNENDRKSSVIETRQYRYIRQMREKFPLHTYLRAAPIFASLRAVKSALEVEVIQKAIDITEQAFFACDGICQTFGIRV